MVAPMPNNEEILDLYRRANAELNAGRAREALALFDQVIAHRPGFAQAHAARGLALAATGLGEEAFAAVAQGVKLDPTGGLVWARSWGDRDHDQGRAVAVDDHGAAIVVGIFRFTLSIMAPAIESVRAEGDRIPKPDAFVVKLDR